MKVIQALKKGKPTLSFEFFPPKTKEGEEKLFQVLSQLKKFNPDYVSVTYGALGTNRERTFFWVKKIKHEFGIEPVAHLTCVAASKDDIRKQIEELESMGIINVLALRGDPPEGEEKFVPPADGFRYASELVAFIKQHYPEVCLGVAGYPEKHPEAVDLETDIKHLKEKVEAGADYVVSQLFFEDKDFFGFKEKCQREGIVVPIIPGLMPITNLKSIKKVTGMCGAKIPEALLKKLESIEEDKAAVEQIGVKHTAAQCQELLEVGVPGLHFFVLNQSGPISRILDELNLR